MPSTSSSPPLSPSGVPGLDDVLDGGFIRGTTYIIQGTPGTGKTTLGLQFALEGVRRGERALYVTLSQREADLRLIARSHGWDLDAPDRDDEGGSGRAGDGSVEIREFFGREVAARMGGRQSVFPTADVELGEIGEVLRTTVEEAKPDRFVFDSIGALRLLADGGNHHYRDEIASLLELLAEHEATALFLDDIPDDALDLELRTLAHGAILLEREAPRYGDIRRRLQVEKVRAHPFHGGWHNYRILTGGVEVYPRLRRPPENGELGRTQIETGVEGIDAMLGGGLEGGTACLIAGATGTGKSTFATLFVYSLLEDGEAAAIFLFGERPETFLRRSEGVGMGLRPHVESGLLHIEVVDTGEISPGEMAQKVREAVEHRGARAVVLDSLTGYYHAMREEELLLSQMREMMAYTSRKGVLSLLVVSQHGIVGGESLAPVDISYMGDSLVLLRNYEDEGEVRRAIAVLKKRYSDHERGIREYFISGEGVRVGEPVRGITGLLTGNPHPTEGESDADR